MEIFYFLLLLVINQFFVFIFINYADDCFKRKNFKTIKCPSIIIRNKNNQKDMVSKLAFFFQIWNYIFILAYLTLASIGIFVATDSYLLFAIPLYSIFTYTGLAFLGAIIVSIW